MKSRPTTRATLPRSPRSAPQATRGASLDGPSNSTDPTIWLADSATGSWTRSAPFRFWFKKAGNQITSDYESLMWQSTPGASGPSFVVDIRGATEPFDIRFSVMTTADTLAYVTIPAGVTPGSWHHVTAVVDDAHLRLTVDQSATELTLMADGAQKSEAPIYFGRVDDGGSSPRFFNGHLDEIRLYRKTLSQPDIDLLFAEGNR